MIISIFINNSMVIKANLSKLTNMVTVSKNGDYMFVKSHYIPMKEWNQHIVPFVVRGKPGSVNFQYREGYNTHSVWADIA